MSLIESRKRPTPTLERVTFKTSRLAEFCGAKELTAQTGHDIGDWPLVILKEIVDNGLDAAEEAGITPEISISVSTESGEIIIADNGPGILAETVTDILDYSVRVSSREAYVSPTRGAQGNALKTILAMPFALDETLGEVLIESRGVAPRIGFAVDQPYYLEPTSDWEAVRTVPSRPRRPEKNSFPSNTGGNPASNTGGNPAWCLFGGNP
jgi:hypothetical protein